MSRITRSTFTKETADQFLKMAEELNVREDSLLQMMMKDFDPKKYEMFSFMPECKYGYDCDRCCEFIEKGCPIFLQNKTKWCVRCSTHKEKQNSKVKEHLGLL